ncbi:MAG TPA: branched-chain amino acid ABC transporter substrate-binding protein [Albitalea sp.]|uniref:branched-chain amino acid ABC transporter substrate-binding protein n=1 Tax=Piscinibacter sp. TaxID=1903157 RepID=UPI002ED34D03
MSRTLALIVVMALAAASACASTLTIGLLQRADDERLAPQRIALAYPGHPQGPARQGAEVAIAESKFQLEAAQLSVKLEVVDVGSADDARSAARRLHRAGASAVLVDLPAPLLLAAADAAPVTLFNIGAADDALREAQCRGNVVHVLPSERMRADALAQVLVARRWQRVLLLHGPGAQDAKRLASVQGALKRFGLKTVAQRPFKLAADPRERELAHPLLLTGGVEHDVVWVVDSDGEFARGLPYRTALPRPVVGDAGLTALAWQGRYERHGAPQLAHRFERHAGRAMTDHDWAAWLAVRAVLQSALERRSWTAPDFSVDGFKGVRLSIRAWDHQVRQPLLLGDGQGVVATAPVEGVLHPREVLDTLGTDAPERLCKVVP